MTTHTRVRMVDDLDGSTDDVATVRFALDGRDDEINLSPRTANALHGTLWQFIEASGRGRTQKTRVNRSAASRAEIRSWALSAGYHVGEHGDVPRAVRAAFVADRESPAHSAPVHVLPVRFPAPDRAWRRPGKSARGKFLLADAEKGKEMLDIIRVVAVIVATGTA